MYNWFRVKVSFDKTMPNGIIKKVTEEYLFDSLSFTESEARTVEELKPYISGEFSISDIKRARISELFFNKDGDRYFKAKVYFLSIDPKSGNEKKTVTTMIAQACDIREALEVIEKGMTGTMADYTIASLTETSIMDVFPYSSEVKPTKE